MHDARGPLAEALDVQDVPLVYVVVPMGVVDFSFNYHIFILN